MFKPAKSIPLGAALLVAIGLAANADPLQRGGEAATAPVATGQNGAVRSPGRQVAALSPADAAPSPNSTTLPEVTVVAPPPYSNGVGPRTSSRSIPRSEPYSAPRNYQAEPTLRPYTSGLGPRVSSLGTVRAEPYEMPADFDSNVAVHPYTSHMGPCPEGANGSGCDRPFGSLIAPSHHNRKHP